MMFKRQIWKFLMSLFKVLNVKKLWTLPSWNISKSFTFLEKILKKAVDAWYGCVSWQNNSFWHFTKQLFLILYSLNHRNSTLRVNTLNVENSVSNYFLRKTFHISIRERLWIQLQKLIFLDYLSHNLFHDNPTFKPVI